MTYVETVLHRIQPLARKHKVAHLSALIDVLPKRSTNRAVLMAELKKIQNQRLAADIELDGLRGLN